MNKPAIIALLEKQQSLRQVLNLVEERLREFSETEPVVWMQAMDETIQRDADKLIAKLASRGLLRSPAAALQAATPL